MYVEEAEKAKAEEWRVAAVSFREVPKNNEITRAAWKWQKWRKR